MAGRARELLARLLELRSRYGDLLLVGLVDYFLCRALQADPHIKNEFVIVHVQRLQELWEDDLEVVARVVEGQAVRLHALLDDKPSTSAGIDGRRRAA